LMVMPPEVWRGTLTIQRSGGITINWKA